MGRRTRAFVQGERVKISAHLGDEADEDGPALALHGEHAIVHGTNPTYTDQDGVERVALTLEETGGLVVAPTQAVRRARNCSVHFRMSADRYREIFGH